MNKVETIDSLQKSNEVVGRENLRALGFERGLNWVNTRGEILGLNRLEKILGPAAASDDPYKCSGTLMGEVMLILTAADENGSHTMASEVWKCATFELKQLPNDEFMQGFVQGALKRCNELRG